jgi:hypothetical protein
MNVYDSLYVFENDEKSAMILMYIIFYLMIPMFIPMCVQNTPYVDLPDPSDDPDKWQIIGYYEGAILYEQTYASGKKAWRFKEDGEYVYPRKREVNKNVTLISDTSD